LLMRNRSYLSDEDTGPAAGLIRADSVDFSQLWAIRRISSPIENAPGRPSCAEILGRRAFG